MTRNHDNKYINENSDKEKTKGLESKQNKTMKLYLKKTLNY